MDSEQKTSLKIKKAFLHLLSQKKYSKITVNDIIEECGINRNTFYYYYPSKYTLLEDVLINDYETLIRREKESISTREWLNFMLEQVLSRKQVFLNLFRSIPREDFEEYLRRISGFVAEEFVKSGIRESQGTEDQNSFFLYCKCLCLGRMVEWFNRGLDDDFAIDTREMIDKTFFGMDFQ